MDPATIIGVALAFGAVFLLIILEGGSIGSIFLLPPLILIFGGTIGVTMAGGYMKDAINIVSILVRDADAGDKGAHRSLPTSRP